MKTPYLDEQQRFAIRHKTISGACCEFDLAFEKLKRSIYKERGLIKGWWIIRKIKQIKIETKWQARKN